MTGEPVARLTVEWECGLNCHEAYTGDFRIPSREAALGVEGRCVRVRVSAVG